MTPEVWDGMWEDGDGRYRERCQPRVIAAALLVVALAGCGAPGTVETHSPITGARLLELINEGSDPDDTEARIAGLVRSPESLPIANAVVILQSDALTSQQERITDEHGFYKFVDLPAGTYTIQVLAGTAHSGKIAVVPESARFVVNFRIDPEVLENE